MRNQNVQSQRELFDSNGKAIDMRDRVVQAQVQVQNKKRNKQKTQQSLSVGIFGLFSFSTSFDIILMVIGGLAALALGAVIPVVALMWGQMTKTYTKENQNLVNETKNIMVIYLFVALGFFILGSIAYAFWMITGERQSNQCKKAYLKALLNQQIEWFDLNNQSQITSKFSINSLAYQGAIGQKNVSIISTLGMFIIGFGIAISKGWLMTLVLIIAVPLVFLAGYLFTWVLQKKDKKTQKFFLRSSGMAQQALQSIKTVKMLNGQQFESSNYQKTITQATKKSLKYIIVGGVGLGFFQAITFASYSLGFWYGSHCVQGSSLCNTSQKYDVQNVIVIFFCILIVAFNFSQLVPALKKISEGRQAAGRIYEIINRKPKISNPTDGIRLTDMKGVIRFENVSFCYPKQPHKRILNNLSFQINQFSNALIGESGCGKSTIFQLLLRFYDPNEGRITIDEVDIKKLDLDWLRENIGYVGQEPVLFATSIRENLIFAKQNTTEEEINEALKKAQVYDFVQSLKQKLDTHVGNGGKQLSGGQKQRIAIARALLKNPKILLLDQATSALDRINERLIQQTLDKISKQKINITIAHRTKTIKNCQMIYVLQNGKISEQGRFQSLNKFKSLSPTYKLQQNRQHSYISQNIDGKTIEQFLVENAEDQQQIVEQQKKEKFQKTGFIQFPVFEQVQKEYLKTLQKQKGLRINKQLKQQKNNPQQVQQIPPQQSQTKKLLQKYQGRPVFRRILSYSKDSCLKLVIALLVATTNGLLYPTFALFQAKVIIQITKFSQDPLMDKDKFRKDVNFYSLIVFIIGIGSFFLNFLAYYLYQTVGIGITNKIRNEGYLKMLKMPVGWHQKQENNPGKLGTILSTDCKVINGLTTFFIGLLVQNFSTLAGALVIGFIYQWRTCLCILALIPFIVIAGIVQMHTAQNYSIKTDQLSKQSKNLIMQSITNIRTVLSLKSQKQIYQKYSQFLQSQNKSSLKKSILSGIFHSFGHSIIVCIFSIILFLGSVFVKYCNVSMDDVFISTYAMVYGAFFIGCNLQFLPDIGLIRIAAINIFQILDEEDQEQIQVREGSKRLKQGIQGSIEFRNLGFKYQTRSQELFKGFNLKLEKGKKVAFVGHSGSGKSTIIQFLLRFYEPSEGEILIDGKNIKDYDIHYLRERFGVVSQQPVLFNQSFRYNIVYNMKGISQRQLIKASQQAHAYEFIVKKSNNQQNPNSKTKNKSQLQYFERNVGLKGNHISGGQKQRIAIARTLLRNPTVIILDQATSALDNANQKIILQSLSSISQQKTTISIAHRIQTIKHSDIIYVFDKGKITQSGDYKSLMQKKGYLFKTQTQLKIISANNNKKND